jgi:hypothetical protein
MTPQRTDWHSLAEQASKEMDSEKLISLVGELGRALDENARTPKWLQAHETNLTSFPAR